MLDHGMGDSNNAGILVRVDELSVAPSSRYKTMVSGRVRGFIESCSQRMSYVI